MKNRYIAAIALAVLSLHSYAQNIKWNNQNSPFAGTKETYAVSFSADGSKVFSGSECSPSYLRIFDFNTGNLLWDYKVNDTLMCIQGVRFSSNGQKAAAIEELGNLLIFDYTTATPTWVSTIPLGTGAAFSVNFSPDGNKVVIGNGNKKLMWYNINGTQIRSIDAHLNYVMCTDWSKAEKIASGGDDAKVKLWDTAGNLLQTMSGHTGSVYGVKISPNGSYVVSASKDKTIKIWDAANGSLVRTLTGHTADVKCVDISDDGTKIVSGGADSLIKIWDFNSGAQLKSFKNTGSGIVYAVDFSPNGKYIAAGTANGDVQLWDLTFNTSVYTMENTTTRIYPNPCADVLQVAGNHVENITVLDASGKIYFLPISKTGDNIRINTTSLPTGNYWLKVIADKQTSTTPFIKK